MQNAHVVYIGNTMEDRELHVAVALLEAQFNALHAQVQKLNSWVTARDEERSAVAEPRRYNEVRMCDSIHDCTLAQVANDVISGAYSSSEFNTLFVDAPAWAVCVFGAMCRQLSARQRDVLMAYLSGCFEGCESNIMYLAFPHNNTKLRNIYINDPTYDVPELTRQSFKVHHTLLRAVLAGEH